MKQITSVLLTSLLLVLMSQPVLADAPEQRGETKNIERRLTALGKGPEEQIQPFTFVWGDKYLKFNGIFEIAASFEKKEGVESAGDLTLATAQLQISTGINENIDGHVVFLYEEVEDEEDTWEIDEAVLHLTHPFSVLNGQIGLYGGRFYLPFGGFNSHFITSPLTQDLGETRASALYLDYLWNDSIELKVCVFDGDTDTTGGSDHIDSFVLAIEATPAEGFNFGASYLGDLAESNIELVRDASVYRSSVSAAAAFISVSYGKVTVEIECVTALDSFDRSQMEANEATGETGELSGRRPNAWNLELALMPVDGWEVALKAEKSQDFAADARRHGMVISHGLFRNTSLSLEYLHSDGDGAENDPTHTTTAQLSVEF